MGCAASTGAAGPASGPEDAQPATKQQESKPAAAQEPGQAETTDEAPGAGAGAGAGAGGPAKVDHSPQAANQAAPMPAPVAVSSSNVEQQQEGRPGAASPTAEQQEGQPAGSSNIVAPGGPASGPRPAAAAAAAGAAAPAGDAAASGPKPPPRTIAAHEHSLNFHAARYNGAFKCDVCCMNKQGESYTCDPCEFDVCLACLEKAAPGGEVGSGPRDGSVSLVAHEHPLREFENRYPEHGGAFKCDICGTHGSGKAWSCLHEACAYDVHPHCMLIAERRG